ncbi:hypothetical protein TD95_000955 [Thielaviopsis punctulata]|uniref:Protein kinase domain-containing protein n=1 Tax=Thielaviopsis punctulata TaxID=72032 RepID=A0A0F4ZF49_9PEZI|nr:hypothetical protein TD95_000955 [Thielaviopsis punctulata]
MFANALKSISYTNISSNYSISSTPVSTAGAWKIYDCKKKSTGKPYSVFVFERKSLDVSSSGLGGNSSSSSRGSSSSVKRAADEVVERLKKEASSLARLRHPSILELVEPVEETRGGGLQFVTEPVVASLTSLLSEKDDQERFGSGAGAGRTSRYTTEDSDGSKKRRELELDELEIQKGLLQLSKALEFLHENAGLVHGNLTPDAILVNSKSDWKISGLAFCSPAENSNKPTSFQPISLSEVLNLDPRLPRFVQLNLDYTSPDFVMDNNITPAADMFSLGLLCVALYTSPHKSPLEAHGSLSSYRRLFSSSSTVPTASNNFLSSKPVPKEMASVVLPRLIARRPAQRMTAKEFQQSEYFDNVLVSTIRFLDSFPAKTPTEKTSFMRGLNKVLPGFPKSVMERKIMPALIEELKDKELLALILQNMFKIVELLPAALARRVFTDKVRPAVKDVFITNAKPVSEKDPARDAGLMTVLENMTLLTNNCNGKEFKDDLLPVYMLAIEASTPSLVDMALRTMGAIMPVLDFSTIKNELFPVIATMFSRTNSLAIKVRGLQAFVSLCGGSNDAEDDDDDGLDGFGGKKKKKTASSALDKYTMQEKIVPLIKVIKTKEPAVMMASLKLLRVIGQVADGEFVAMDILPILWSMSLGPLLNLQQFQAFMELIRQLSRRVEDEQTKKLQELSGTDTSTVKAGEDFLAFGGVTGTQFDAPAGGSEDDFERLVKGRVTAPVASPTGSAWGDGPARAHTPIQAKRTSAVADAPTFSWSTPPPPPQQQQQLAKPKQQTLSRFEPLAPSSTQFSQPLKPMAKVGSVGGFSGGTSGGFAANTSTGGFSGSSTGGIDWSAATKPAWPTSSSTSSFGAPPPPQISSLNTSMASLSMNQPQQQQQQKPSWGTSGTPSTSFSLPPPPGASISPSSANASWARPAAAASNTGSMNMGMGMGMGMGMSMSAMTPMNTTSQQAKPAGGLDKYESLL